VAADTDERFVAELLAWYETNGRHDLAWRTADAPAFEVLVAELMLQQTTVEQVRNVYSEFVDRYPTPEAVVDADRTRIAALIEPLGLPRRVEYLVRAAERLCTEHDGRVPSNRSDLLDLHGVGEYTARSVLSHAYGRDEPAVDTNVTRVLSRVFRSETGQDPSPAELHGLADRLVPGGSSSDFTHALIDFGAEMCTATDPNCDDCPTRDVCEYYEHERELLNA